MVDRKQILREMSEDAFNALTPGEMEMYEEGVGGAVPVGEAVSGMLDSVRSRIEAYGVGDRPSSPPASLLEAAATLEEAS